MHQEYTHIVTILDVETMAYHTVTFATREPLPSDKELSDAVEKHGHHKRWVHIINQLTLRSS